MTLRNFEEDLRNSNDPKVRKAWEKVFKLKFGEGCKVDWKDDKKTQLDFGTDITITTKSGRRYSIELKTRNFRSLDKDWIMEIVSHIYDKEDKETRKHLRKKDGWIYTTTAEYLFHGTLNENRTDFLEAIFYSLMPFKTENWKSEFINYPPFWLSTLYGNGEYQLTLNKLIPKEIIKKDAFEFWEWGKDEENIN